MTDSSSLLGKITQTRFPVYSHIEEMHEKSECVAYFSIIDQH